MASANQRAMGGRVVPGGGVGTGTAGETVRNAFFFFFFKGFFYKVFFLFYFFL